VATSVKKGLSFSYTQFGIDLVFGLDSLPRSVTLSYIKNILVLHRCHGPISPPNPDFTLKPTKKKMEKEKHIESTPGTPCPPCQEVVLVPCLGQHLDQERAVRFKT
jgi:hypothetical protein